ncbi:MAG: hypothetical protein ABSH52_02010 [Terriglobia bacterium]
MSFRILRLASLVAVLLAPALLVFSDEPIIPPALSRISPAGIERGTTASFKLEGRGLVGARSLLFDTPGFTAKIVNVTALHEEIKAARAGVDLEAAVPLGVKSEAQVELTVSKDVEPGIHWFRIETPNGTSNMLPLAVGSLKEVQQQRNSSDPQQVELPATIVGAVSAVGEVNSYSFEGKAGQEMVFQVVASKLDSQLESLLVLRDSSGEEIAGAGEYLREPDATLVAKLPREGRYTISISDREEKGGWDYFYRLNAGPLPYVTGWFPLGVRAGTPAMVSIEGVNLGGVKQVEVRPPAHVDGWTTLPLTVATPSGPLLNKPRIGVGDVPEVFEKEPNDTPAQAEAVSIPVTINGHIDNPTAAKHADDDYFRIHAGKGQHLVIEVAAARLGSPLDSVVEVLDSRGNAVPRATVRCLYQTQTTLADRDSRSEGIRLVSTTGLHENDYLMVGDELDQIAYIPDQPDADVILKGFEGQRFTWLGTSPSLRPLNTTVYKVQILPPDAEFPSNGLPVFHLTERNDDGGPGYGADSRLDFDAPADGDYLVHLKDVRNLGGAGFAYRLTIREAAPDFTLVAYPDNPNIPQGGSTPVTVSVSRLQGYEGPIEIEVTGLPEGLTASKAEIAAGEDSTLVVLSAAPGSHLVSPPAHFEIVGHAIVTGRAITRVANADKALQVASIIPPPDVEVRAQPEQVAIAPDKEVSVSLHVERKNGFKGRVPCDVVNLPPGVRVVNLGLNGILVPENQSDATFKLRAADWAKPIVQPIYVLANVESNATTQHPSPPIMVRVEGKGEGTSVAAR